ncbi:MAG: nucleoside hydrolase [Candidatus Poribacteria bacterium]|nr:nucleoside hydrolase [Candidatus Poribacteria bacterium]
MNFPKLSASKRLEMLQPPTGQVRMVLDTDTYNEIDDQFAVVHALLSPEHLNVEALYAAPFHNNRSANAEDGMEKSYDEILRLLDFLNVPADGFVYRGSRAFLSDKETPVPSDAATDMIERALTASPEEPLYVVAVGAITNVASAILIAPEIIERIVIVWLGGNPLYWPHTREFNLMQDLQSAQVVLDCGVPFVWLPARGVVSHLHTTVAEMERYVQGRGKVGDYLVEIFKDYASDHFAWSKVIWDISATAYLINPAWVPTEIVHSPILTEAVTWSFDNNRHLMRVASSVNRDAIFRDLFEKLQAHSD